MIAADALAEAAAKLSKSGIKDGLGDGRKILRHVLSGNSAYLETAAVLSEEQLGNFRSMIVQRCAHQPVAQIIGMREFWGRPFKVTQATLDPRPDSELLIETALSFGSVRSLLDLGTGTGCLLLTYLSERPEALGVGIDWSPEALTVAHENAGALTVADRASFVQSNWFDNVQGRFDLILCNPPYITEAEMVALEPDVAQWEPRMALTPGGDGLGAYRTISDQLAAHLTKDGVAIFEIGMDQAEAVCAILTRPDLQAPRVLKDLNGKDRVVWVRKAS